MGIVRIWASELVLSAKRKAVQTVLFQALVFFLTVLIPAPSCRSGRSTGSPRTISNT